MDARNEERLSGETGDGGEDVIVRAPVSARYAGGAGPGGNAGLHVVAANHRFARAVLGFEGLRPGAWSALRFRLAYEAGEASGLSADSIGLGFDFLAGDGSSLDLDHVPGLVRSLLDPHAAWIPGPALAEGLVRVAFRMPDQARDLAVTVRSWRNTAPVTVSDPVILVGLPDPGVAPRRRLLETNPLSLHFALPDGVGLALRGQITAPQPDEHAARVRLVYRDRAGSEIAPPYPGAVSVPGLGAVFNLSAVPQARRFTLDLRPPTGAAGIDLDFGPWEDATKPTGAELIGVLELALEDAFRLESLCGEDALDAPAFLARLADRLGLPEDAAAGWLAPAGEGATVAPLARARALRAGPDRTARLDPEGGVALSLAGLPEWSLPEAPNWREDPFRSVAWRLAYQSLAWLLPLVGQTEGAGRPAELAAAWSAANPWGQPSDPLSLHPAALAPRGEVLAHLLRDEAVPRGAVAAEAARHGFALAEIVGQNTLARGLPGIQSAAALLALARALPAFPFAAFWETLARRSLDQGFDALLGADGAFAESALQRRLDLLGHGRGLAEALGEAAPGPTLAVRVAAALPGLAHLVDPGGRLPPFGDGATSLDQAGWIARLLQAEAGDLVAARDEASTEPAAEAADVTALRYDGPERGWASFACQHAGQTPQEHRDCTSFVFATGGSRWIVEGGGEGVETGAARHFLLSPRAHNVAIPDGREPMAGRAWPTARFDLDGARVLGFASNVHGPDYAHARFFVILDDLSGLAVLDRFVRRGDAEVRAVSFEGLLHLPPETLVALSGPRRALARQEGGRLDFQPWTVTGQGAGLDVVIGRSDRPGRMQGFVAAGNGSLRAAPVLRYAFTGRGSVCGGMIVATDGEAERRLVRLLGTETVRRLVEGG
ncbi:heparinase II/III domain-containing protein [Methylorubrum salsuginis]|uniref:Heparinase II/III-like protein n=1 Tax=Methylorubrum salsuginis TaxID=414703 RepID=A0A1I4GYH7_9HYPH|nr:heparinase II/III family protein [Methylorubrum salsuginis]SFL35098.1 Heparinase II/III-like protein [Methylorubrum salsuginis]